MRDDRHASRGLPQDAARPGDPADDAVRRLAGGCYLALRTGDAAHLPLQADADVLDRSGLAGMHANLCQHLGIASDRATLIRGMQLSAVNTSRWNALASLLASLESEDGIAPVLFKGGALHARWPLMRELRAMSDYDLIVPQAQVGALREALARRGFASSSPGSWLTRWLTKGWMACKGTGHAYQNLDVHARVTEPPVCASLTRDILGSDARANGIRVPAVEDCICMIALHVVRSGMHRPLREYVDLLWHVEALDDAGWQSLRSRAARHHLLPALFLSLRQARHCLALDELAPDRAASLGARIAQIESDVGAVRRRMIDWLAPPDYPLHPLPYRDRPMFRRSLILGAGTSSAWRVAAAFVLYGASRIGDGARPTTPEGDVET
jgi:hypothetical protein